MDTHIKIRQKRIEQGYNSAKKFAEWNGLNRSSYQRIEQGGDCLVSTLKKIAEKLKVDVKELI